MTAPSLYAAALAVDRRRARSVQRKLGPSALGECRRRAGYIHHRTPQSNPENSSSLPAISGTWFHKGALEALRVEAGALIETRLADDVIRGNCDAISLPLHLRQKIGPVKEEVAALLPDVVVVEDLKTKRDARMVDYVRHRGPTMQQLFQAHKYAAMFMAGAVMTTPKRQAALADLGPIEVQRIRLRYVDRNGDDEYIWEEDFDADVAEAADDWLRQILLSSKPEDLPRDLDGPGLSVICDNCPWLTECWGVAPEGATAQSQLVTDLETVLEALEEYATAQVAESDAKQRKAFARAKLDGLPNLLVPGFKLKWSGGKIPVDAVPQVDLDELLRRFEETRELYRKAGLKPLDVPYLPVRRSARTIRVTRNPSS